MRQIRSFVRRKGRISPRRTNLLQSSPYLIQIDSDASCPLQPQQWDTLFGWQANNHVVELGFGDGASLYTMAKAAPTTQFIGIEVYQTGAAKLLEAIQETQLNNIRLYIGDGSEFLKDHIPAQSVDRVQLFFPDPWHKKRHHKRRLIQAAFLGCLQDKLKPGGQLHLATDWADYANHAETVVAQFGHFVTHQLSERPDYRPVTKYEKRGLRLGHAIYDRIFELVSTKPCFHLSKMGEACG